MLVRTSLMDYTSFIYLLNIRNFIWIRSESGGEMNCAASLASSVVSSADDANVTNDDDDDTKREKTCDNLFICIITTLNHVSTVKVFRKLPIRYTLVSMCGRHPEETNLDLFPNDETRLMLTSIVLLTTLLMFL